MTYSVVGRDYFLVVVEAAKVVVGVKVEFAGDSKPADFAVVAVEAMVDWL